MSSYWFPTVFADTRNRRIVHWDVFCGGAEAGLLSLMREGPGRDGGRDLEPRGRVGHVTGPARVEIRSVRPDQIAMRSGDCA